jgi:hypothetical protein
MRAFFLAGSAWRTGVARMLRSAPLLRRDALPIRGPAEHMGPGSAEQR